VTLRASGLLLRGHAAEFASAAHPAGKPQPAEVYLRDDRRSYSPDM
jgi:hypothetical protein